ncbi:MAG TPA: protein kinase [Planctomycetota bacterium]|nr:protein kinase [Planctomycetota bacterium]
MTLDPRILKDLSRYLAPSAGGEIADRALAENLIRLEDLEDCLKEQDRTGTPLDQILISRGYLTREMADRLRQPPLPPEAAAVADDPARIVGTYVLVSLLGKGGMAEVWKAWDRRLSRWVAIKLLKEEVGHGTKRIEREGKAAGGLLHPNIIPVYEVGHHQDRPFLVMALVEGKAPESPLPIPDAIRIVRQIASALECVHRTGVIHRDVKPGNIILEPGGRPLLGDFGLAITGEMSPAEGEISGTPQYASPEQLRGELLDHRTDVYSLGATLYHLITGHPPYSGKSPQEVSASQRLGKLTFPPRLPWSLRAILQKAMALERENRYPAVAEFGRDLENIEEARQLRGGWKPSAWGALILAALLSSGVTYALLRANRMVSDRKEAARSFHEGRRLLSLAEQSLVRGPQLRPAEAKEYVSKAMPEFFQALWLGGDKDPDASAGLGRCFELMGQYDRALQAYEKAADVSEGRMGLARSGMRRFLNGWSGKDWKAWALEHVSHLESPSPSPTMELIRQFGQGNWEEALRQGLLAVDSEPLDDLGYLLLGWSAREAGKLEESLRWIEEAHRLRGEDPMVWYQFGLTYQVKGNSSEARKALSRAVLLADAAWTFLPEATARLALLGK